MQALTFCFFFVKEKEMKERFMNRQIKIAETYSVLIFFASFFSSRKKMKKEFLYFRI